MLTPAQRALIARLDLALLFLAVAVSPCPEFATAAAEEIERRKTED